MTKKCDICYRNNCNSFHNEVIKYIFYLNGDVYLSVNGQKKLGSNYLNKLRANTNMKPSYNKASKQYAKCVICGKKFVQKKSNHVSCSKYCQNIKIKQSK